MDEFREEPSKYIWRWTRWSWICVGVAALIVVMGLTSGGSLTPWIFGAIAMAVVGGVLFGFIPRASLDQPKRPMTAGAARKNAARKAKSAGGGGGAGGPGAGGGKSAE